MRSSSYHSPTRCNSPISSTQQANIISRPSSPAGSNASQHSSRHSTYTDRERSGSIHPALIRTPSNSPQQQQQQQQQSLNQQGQQLPVQPAGCSPNSPSGGTSAAHQRASSGPTVAINVFHDPEVNNSKLINKVKV